MASPSALADDAGQVAGAVRPLSTPAADASSAAGPAASWYAPAERRRSRWARRRAASAAAVGPASWFAAQSVGAADTATRRSGFGPAAPHAQGPA